MSGLRLCFVLALGHCLLAAVVGCSTVQRLTPGEESKVRAAQLQELQLKVMRFADDYTGRISDPIAKLDLQSTPPEVRLRAHNWRVSQATAAYTIASGANPTINALDMVVLATLSRAVVEDRLIEDYGERARALLDAHRHLEQQSWSLVDGVLNAEQAKEVRAAIDRWRAENPTTRSVAQVRFADFAALELRRGKEQQESNGLFGFIGLDPLSNLDPAVRELEQTRQLAERTIYYLQRAPSLLDMEIERLVYQLAAMPEAERTLANIDRLSLAAEAMGQLSARAPEIIASERHAIITELASALHAEQDRLQPLLVSVRDVLNAGTQTSQSVTGTVTALDAFVARFQPDEPASANASTPKRPFDITEYAATARDLAAAAERVQALLAQLNTSSKDVERVTRAATQEVNGIIDHVFKLALVLILVLGFVTVLCALLYRYWSPRLPSVRMARVPPLT
ncbi:MAG TPA: hypothetical protein VN705_12515 [Steroidobacteraceae bacterium]|jgi:methyl-accepting chemotaxis protein|nr:hypothetical protein [Steroidobacteraceae bacterium]